LQYTEKNAKTQQEGKIAVKDFNLKAGNVTNVAELIKQNPVCTACISGKILESSPFSLHSNFIWILQVAGTKQRAM
jgi:hypothetical protein